MEKILEMPLETPTQLENSLSGERTPPQTLQSDQKSQNSGNDLRKTSTPDRLRVPKAFKYQERYRSPTDLMMSPVSKGLLARSRKTGALLPPAKNPQKSSGFCDYLIFWTQVFRVWVSCKSKIKTGDLAESNGFLDLMNLFGLMV
ncbi:hypothetical protein HHK36_007359 [Tetracentron sinense]|uniref:Uncharacterized protein n=1 Tax=Tetracentron sinense TaxID=13715 RepID=A0A835DPU2_TETSI|nr:hypothetical protein HHK36_007359 [Tetracentron sinense]